MFCHEPQDKSSTDSDIIYWLVLIAVVGGLLWIVNEKFLVHPGTTSQANACINNLRQIDAAAAQFALDNHLTNGAPIRFPNDLTPYIKLNAKWQIPGCPQGGIYSISRVGDAATCSLGTNVYPAHVYHE